MKIWGTAMVNAGALAISSGMNFLALFLWTRLLDPGAFGSYALISASALLVNAIMFDWLRVVAARLLYDPQVPSGINPQRGNALAALVLGMALLLLLAAVGLWLARAAVFGMQPDWVPLIACFALSEMALAMVNTVSRLRMQAWQFFRSMVARSGLSLLLGLTLVLGFHLGARGVIVGTIVGQGLAALAGLVFNPVWRAMRPLQARWPDLREALILGYPLIGGSALTFGVGVADRYLVSSMMGTRAVGFYAAPTDLLQKTVVFVMLAINLTSYPALIRAYEDHGPQAAGRLLEHNFLLQFALGFPAAVSFTVLAPGLANLLLGPTFRSEGAVLLPVIGVAALLRCFIGYHLTMAFQLTKRMKLMMVGPAVALVVLILGGIVGIREAGLFGMAVAAAGAQACSYAVCAVLAKRVFAFKLITRDIVKVAIAGVIMGLVMLPARHYAGIATTLVTLAIGGGIYALAMLLLRIEPLRPIERRLLARLRPAKV
jgi:O-antigen/teichoic acid export membrane protein